MTPPASGGMTQEDLPPEARTGYMEQAIMSPLSTIGGALSTPFIDTVYMPKTKSGKRMFPRGCRIIIPWWVIAIVGIEAVFGFLRHFRHWLDSGRWPGIMGGGTGEAVGGVGSALGDFVSGLSNLGKPKEKGKLKMV